jgi:hypothetical protein
MTTALPTCIIGPGDRPSSIASISTRTAARAARYSGASAIRPMEVVLEDSRTQALLHVPARAVGCGDDARWRRRIRGREEALPRSPNSEAGWRPQRGHELGRDYPPIVDSVTARGAGRELVDLLLHATAPRQTRRGPWGYSSAPGHGRKKVGNQARAPRSAAAADASRRGDAHDPLARDVATPVEVARRTRRLVAVGFGSPRMAAWARFVARSHVRREHASSRPGIAPSGFGGW